MFFLFVIVWLTIVGGWLMFLFLMYCCLLLISYFLLVVYRLLFVDVLLFACYCLLCFVC